MRYIFLIIICISGFRGFSQNLVLNSSFEDSVGNSSLAGWEIGDSTYTIISFSNDVPVNGGSWSVFLVSSPFPNPYIMWKLTGITGTYVYNLTLWTKYANYVMPPGIAYIGIGIKKNSSMIWRPDSILQQSVIYLYDTTLSNWQQITLIDTITSTNQDTIAIIVFGGAPDNIPGVNDTVSIDLIELTVTDTLMLTQTSDVSCNGYCNGSASVELWGGIPPFSYQWDDSLNQTTQAASGLCAGTYTVIVTDSIGQIDTVNVTIDEPTPISFLLNSFPDSSGAGKGVAWIAVTGGTPPFTYQWNDPVFQTTDTAYNLTSGTYTVIVTDSSGCTDSGSVFVSDITGISENTTKNDIQICPNPFSDHTTITFNNQKNNRIQLTLFTITGQVNKQIETDKNKITIKKEELAPGMYFYQIINYNNRELLGRGKLVLQ